jgi:CBS domain containing-hemolysin-like protein
MRLLDPVSKYLAETREEQGRSSDFVVCCDGDTLLKRAVELLAQNNVHRIFVVDKFHILEGVLSMTDIIRECFD